MYTLQHCTLRGLSLGVSGEEALLPGLEKVPMCFVLCHVLLATHLLFEGQNEPKFQALCSITCISEILALICLRNFVLWLLE